MYSLYNTDASNVPDSARNVGLIWTHPPVMPWLIVMHKLSFWQRVMADFGSIIVCRKDFDDEDELVSVVREDILVHTNEGDLIVDPFCGGSTTGIAALSLGRKYMGIDSSPIAIKTSERRLYAYC